MRRPFNITDSEAVYLEDLLESDCHSGLGAPALLEKLRRIMRLEGLPTTEAAGGASRRRSVDPSAQGK